jgi:MFS family permease
MAAGGQPSEMRDTSIHRARLATAAIFFLTGAVMAAWSTRLPAIQEKLHLTPGALGLAILGLEGGAVAGLSAGGALVARLGSRGALRLGIATYPLGLVVVGFAGGAATLGPALAAMAFANSIVDVGMNAQGVELERRAGRPLLSGLHAGHSLGLAAGGMAGTIAAGAGVPVRTHFAATAAFAIVAGASAAGFLVRERPSNGGPRFVVPRGPLLPLAAIAFGAFLLDGAAYNWTAVDLRTEQHAGPGLAAAAFTLFALALAAGRLAGDRLVARHGRSRAVTGGGLVAAAGSALAIAAPGPLVALAGWGVFGLGLAVIAPTVLGAAPGVGDAPPSVAIAAVATVGYLGSFAGPPAIGAVAGVTGLSVALGLLVAVALAVAGLAPRALRGTSGASGPARPRP